MLPPLTYGSSEAPGSHSILVLVSHSQWLAPCTGLSLADVHVSSLLATFYLIAPSGATIYDCFS